MTAWRKFYKFALVTADEFLSHEDFSKHYFPGLFEVKCLLQLFKKLLMFAKISDTVSFVPALIHDISLKDINKYRESNPALALMEVQERASVAINYIIIIFSPADNYY